MISHTGSLSHLFLQGTIIIVLYCLAIHGLNDYTGAILYVKL